MAIACLLWMVGAVNPLEPGPYRVGAVTVVFKDEARGGRVLRTEIWYPADPNAPAPASPKPRGVFGKTVAIEGLPPAPGPFPLLVFSHGAFAVREQSSFLTEHLASHGYVVASPDHPGSTARDLRKFDKLGAAMERPVDLKVVIDRMLAKANEPNDPLRGKLQTDRVAALGHSFGAYTALAVGGAHVTTRYVKDKASQANVPDDIDFKDQRVRAVIAYAPPMKPAFVPEGVTHCVLPTLIMGGTLDEITEYADSQIPVFEALGGPCYLAGLVGGAHYSFNNHELTRVIQAVVKNKPTISPDESQRLVIGVTMGFLSRHLLGKDEFAEFLAPRPTMEFRARNLSPSAKEPAR